MIKILNTSFFNASSTRTAQQRANDLKVKTKKPTKDYFEFGESYFDGGKLLPGYGRYLYDGRYARAVNKLPSIIGLSKSDNICEVGCAKGFILYEFYTSGFKNIWGFDISKYAIKNSPKEISEYMHISKADSLGLPTSSIDFLYTKEMIPHLPLDEVNSFYKEVNRVLKPHGKVYFEIQYPQDESKIYRIIDWDPTHKTLLSQSEWKKTFSLLRSDLIVYVHFKKLFIDVN
jgi:SAM-dependent methyltransferase